MRHTDDELATAWGLVSEAHAAVTRRVFAPIVDALGLSPSWFEILLRLSRSPDRTTTSGHLAQQVSFSTGGLTKAIDRLCEHGWVVRSLSSSDRRVVHVTLTGAGAAVVERAVSMQAEGLRRHLVQPLGGDAVEELLRLARVLRAGAVGSSDTTGH